MQASAVAMPLMKYSFAEIKRRSVARTKSSSFSGNTGPISEASAADLEDLVRILQRSENHLLATRILLGSWHSSPSKAQVHLSLIICYFEIFSSNHSDVAFIFSCFAHHCCLCAEKC